MFTMPGIPHVFPTLNTQNALPKTAELQCTLADRPAMIAMEISALAKIMGAISRWLLLGIDLGCNCHIKMGYSCHNWG